jgi:hypothetical protein
MTTYVLLSGVTAAGSAPTFLKPPAAVATPGGGANTAGVPPTNQSFQATVSSAVAGTVGASVHLVGSNDYNPGSNTGNWQDINTISPLAVANGNSPQVSFAAGSIAFQSFGAWVGAVTGTGATITVVMNA